MSSTPAEWRSVSPPRRADRWRFLIDPDAVLQSVRSMDDGDEAADPARLLEEVRTIRTEPLIIEPGEPHEPHH
jgi:hypothetical protein